MNQAEYGQIIRQMRHEYGNLLQVAGSYLDMGLIAEVKEFIHKEILKWHEEHAMLCKLSESFLPYLFYQRIKVRELGIDLRYKEIRMSSVEDLIRCGEPGASIADLTVRVGSAELNPLIYVSCQEDEQGFEVYIEGTGFPPITVRHGKE